MLTAGRPRVVTAAVATPATSAGTAAAAGPGGLADLGGGVLQAGADLVDVDLEDRALLALAGLVAAGLEPAGDDHPHAADERLGGVLGRLPPDRAVEEERLAVLPLVRLPVERPRRRGHGEVRDSRTRGGEAELGVSGEVADHGDRCFACHGLTPSSWDSGGDPGPDRSAVGERSPADRQAATGCQVELVGPVSERPAG